MKLLRALTIAALAVEAAALAIGGKQMTVERDSDGLQDIVTTPFFSSRFRGIVFNYLQHQRVPEAELYVNY
jgi:hypothetical protein